MTTAKKPAPAIKRGGTETVEPAPGLRFTLPTLRDDKYTGRRDAFTTSADALQPLNRVERTQVVAALAEFFQLSLSVENNT